MVRLAVVFSNMLPDFSYILTQNQARWKRMVIETCSNKSVDISTNEGQISVCCSKRAYPLMPTKNRGSPGGDT